MLDLLALPFRPVCWVVGHDWFNTSPHVEQRVVRIFNMTTGELESHHKQIVTTARHECAYCGAVRLGEVTFQ